MNPFFLSIFLGVLTWLLLFIITPAQVTYSMNLETLLFVVASYISLVLGFVIYNPKTIKKSTILFTKRTIFYISIFIIICYIIRFIDVFYYRQFRFSNTISRNRELAGNGSQNLVFIVSSVFKSLYFAPLLLLLSAKIKTRWLLFLSSLLFILPLLEAILRGSRSVVFQSFVFLVIILVITKTIKFSKQNILFFFISLGILFIASTQILLNREGPKNENPYKYLVEKAIYNDFYKPKQAIIDYMNDESISNNNKKIRLSALQIGQYYTHGLFEFDYVVKHYQKEPFKKQYGKYTFQVFPKFTNRFGLTNHNLENIYLASPRGYTFISFFGGMYLDFGWFALILFFLLGVFQKISYQKIKNKVFIFAPLFVFLLFTNFFMLTFNFFRGSGTYTLISCVIFAILFSFLLNTTNNKNYEKGIST